MGVSRRITGPERKRLRQMAQDLLPANFSLTVRTEAVGLGREELEKDLARLMETWKEVLERASAAAVAAEHGMEGAMPVLLHRAMGQFLTVVRDFFNDKVMDKASLIKSLVIESLPFFFNFFSFVIHRKLAAGRAKETGLLWTFEA